MARCFKRIRTVRPAARLGGRFALDSTIIVIVLVLRKITKLVLDVDLGINYFLASSPGEEAQ
jgi:hypothetical protein